MIPGCPSLSEFLIKVRLGLASRNARGFTIRIPSEGSYTLNPATSGEVPITPMPEPPIYPADCPRNSKKLAARQRTIGANMARTSITSSDAHQENVILPFLDLFTNRALYVQI